MNDSAFSTLENFLCSSSLPSDLMVMAQMHLVETDLAPTTAHYLKEFNAPQPAQNEHQHQHIFHHTQPQQQQVQYGNSIASNATLSTQTGNVTQDCNGNSSAAEQNPSNSTANSVAPYANIPFVQIHTTDVQPRSGFNGSTFRRTVTSHEEIKSEPIKSEGSDAAKDRVNATPTPPGGRGVGREVNAVDHANAEVNRAGESANTNMDKTVSLARTECCTRTLPAVYKCCQCLFLSLSESGVNAHVATTHQGELFNNANELPPRIACPGCENIFYTHNSIETHLRDDHLMSTEDAEELMRAIREKYNSIQQPAEKCGSGTVANGDESLEKGTQRRSRIYLKNVECLRAPRREPIEQQNNLISDSFFHFENDCSSMAHIMEEQDFIGMLAGESMENNNGNTIGTYTHNNNNNNSNNRNHNNNHITHNDNTVTECRSSQSANPPKQKISIKSVDVLREPTLLRRDYEMQSFNNFINACNDLDTNMNSNNAACANANNVDQFTYSTASGSRSTMNANDSSVLGPSEGSAANDLGNLEKPRRPKIYIKNVDILKEPMSFTGTSSGVQESSAAMNFNFMQPTLTQGTVSYLDVVENLSVPTAAFDNASALKQLPIGTLSEQYLFDNGSNNFMPSVSELPEAFNYVSGSSGGSFLMDTSRYVSAMDCGPMNSSHPSGTTPIMTEPTPPPPPLPALPMPETVTSSSTQSLVDTPSPAPVSLPIAPGGPASVVSTKTQKQKIFIKNVDILKEPQFQEQRGTLHLRTVDELNLMNKNEVENLIAPNLDNTQTTAILQEDELNEHFNSLSTNVQLPDVDEVTPSAESLYEDDTFKLQDFTAQGVHNWNDDYDLGDDIREIITDTAVPAANLDTPQMTLISIRDIEELTGGQQQSMMNTFECEDDVGQNITATAVMELAGINEDVISAGAVAEVDLFGPADSSSSMAEQCLKQERSNTNASTEQRNSPVCPAEVNGARCNDIPPLTPMTTSGTSSTPQPTTPAANTLTTGLPVPPLVPMSPLVQINTSAMKANTVGALGNAASSTSSTSACPPSERGRIYVANNLMQTSPPPTASSGGVSTTVSPTSSAGRAKQGGTPIAVSVTGGTSVRGRPFGSNRTGITKVRKQPDHATAAGVYVKCTVAGCAFRFKKAETLEYHIKCHNSNASPPSPQAMLCPECRSTEFTNWNTLHTHLWRSHKIDMELYSCELCTFKTPIYSRLLNTHSKIHFEDRNYKCDQCEKAFKNTKQLKNHRRWHRNHAGATTGAAPASTTQERGPECESAAVAPARTFYRCKDCDAVFSHRRTLREHVCKNADSAVQCEVCERVLSSKSSLRLHMQTHEATRRFKCGVCGYTANDHNAFRRHKMTHDNAKMYKCAHCNYKSIQSVAYQKHVQLKHPELADSIIYKCNACPYATISQSLFTMHRVRHESNNDQLGKTISEGPIAAADDAASCMESAVEKALVFVGEGAADAIESMPKTKIKVKSHLTLSLQTPPTDANVAYVSALPAHSLETAIT